MKFKYSKIPIVLLLTLVLISCTTAKWEVKQITGSKIVLDASKERLVDPEFNDFLDPYKQKIDATMNEVLAHAPAPLRAFQPESPLTNLSADVYRLMASEMLGEQVDIGIVNLGGLRTSIPSGDITLGKVFEVMPFKNELDIVWLKGKYVLDLMDQIAAQGGEGVSGISFKMEGDKATNVMIGGQTVILDKIYTIATNSFVAQGNDHMEAILNNVKIKHTGAIVRDIFIEYLKSENAAGRPIKASVEGRIIREKP